MRRDIRVRIRGRVYFEDRLIKQWQHVNEREHPNIGLLADFILVTILEDEGEVKDELWLSPGDNDNLHDYIVANYNINLFMNGYEIPRDQPVRILRDGDLIRFKIHKREPYTTARLMARNPTPQKPSSTHAIDDSDDEGELNTPKRSPALCASHSLSTTTQPRIALAPTATQENAPTEKPVSPTEKGKRTNQESQVGTVQQDSCETATTPKTKSKRRRRRKKNNTTAATSTENGGATQVVQAATEGEITGCNAEDTTGMVGVPSDNDASEPTAGRKRSRKRSKKSKKTNKQGNDGEDADVVLTGKTDVSTHSGALGVVTDGDHQMVNADEKTSLGEVLPVTTTKAESTEQEVSDANESGSVQNGDGGEKKPRKRKRSAKKSRKVKKVKQDSPEIAVNVEANTRHMDTHDTSVSKAEAHVVRAAKATASLQSTAAQESTQGESNTMPLTVVAVRAKANELANAILSSQRTAAKESTQHSSMRTSKGTIGGVESAAAPATDIQQPVSAKVGTESGCTSKSADAGEGTLARKPKVVYDQLPKLSGPPRKGDVLVFKMMEMDANYCPGLSKFKEATVAEYDGVSDTAVLKLRYYGNKRKHVSPHADPDNWYYHQEEPRDKFDMGDEFVVESVGKSEDSEMTTTMAALMDVRLLS